MAISKQTKRLILLFFISLILDIALAPLRGVNFMASSIASLTVFFLLVWFYCRRWRDIKPWKILLIVFLGWLPLNLSARALSFGDSLVSLPDALMHILGMIGGYLFYIAGRKWRWAVAAAGAALCSLIFPAYDAWLHYLNFGTVSGRVEQVAIQPLQVRDAGGREFPIGGDGIVYVLDFWTTSCGVCFREFPKFEEFATEYSGREDIKLYAVNVPRGEETDSDILYIFYRYCSRDFPVVIARDLDINGNVLGIKSVPAIIVIDGKGKMIYRGGLEGAKKAVTGILK